MSQGRECSPEDGDLALVGATPEEWRERGRLRDALSGEKTWNTFALVDGIAYVRNHHEMACYDLREEAGAQ